MASNKAKRSVHLAQPERRSRNQQLPGSTQHSAVGIQPNKTEHPTPSVPAEALMPVKAHIYRALAELNGGFEKVIQDLKTLQQVNFLRSERLAGMSDLICGIRAEANRECLGILGERETANQGHFAGLRRDRENRAGEQKPREISPA